MSGWGLPCAAGEVAYFGPATKVFGRLVTVLEAERAMFSEETRLRTDDIVANLVR